MTLKTDWILDEIVSPNHMNDICRNINENTKKLNGIDNNANNYIHPDKHPANIIEESSGKRFVSDSEKNNWNNKANSEHEHSKNDITDFSHRHNMSDIDGFDADASSINYNKNGCSNVDNALDSLYSTVNNLNTELDGQRTKAISLHNRLDKIF